MHSERRQTVSYGIDIGGTKMELGAFDGDLQRLFTRRIPTPTQDYQLFLKAIQGLVVEADREIGERAPVGVGLPCAIGEGERHSISANIPCINGQPLKADLVKLLARDVVLENDSNAFALSEAFGGAADGQRRVLGVILGTGIGGGLVIDGEVYRGRQGLACEFGHIPMATVMQERYQLPLRPCGCGLTGCVEQYLAGPGLLWLAGRSGEQYPNLIALAAAVEAGSAEARAAMYAYRDCLGSFLAQLTILYDPDVMVIGGGLSNISDIYDKLSEFVRPHLFKDIEEPPIVVPRFGDSGGVRGVALLAARALTQEISA